jgi:uncharacterized lipoprotein YmbA
MKVFPGRIAAALLLLTGAGAGCFSPGKSAPPRFYVLSAASDTTSPPPAVRSGPEVVVLPIELPELLDRPQMVVRTGANEVDILEFDRWGEPLEDGIEQVVLDDLAGLLPDYRFYRGRVGARQDEHLVLQIRIEQFAPGPDAAVHLRSWWVFTSSTDRIPPVEKRSEIDEPIAGGLAPPDQPFDAGPAVVAMNRALNRMAAEIAAAIREGSP